MDTQTQDLIFFVLIVFVLVLGLRTRARQQPRGHGRSLAPRVPRPNRASEAETLGSRAFRYGMWALFTWGVWRAFEWLGAPAAQSRHGVAAWLPLLWQAWPGSLYVALLTITLILYLREYGQAGQGDDRITTRPPLHLVAPHLWAALWLSLVARKDADVQARHQAATRAALQAAEQRHASAQQARQLDQRVEALEAALLATMANSGATITRREVRTWTEWQGEGQARHAIPREEPYEIPSFHVTGEWRYTHDEGILAVFRPEFDEFGLVPATLATWKRIASDHAAYLAQVPSDLVSYDETTHALSIWLLPPIAAPIEIEREITAQDLGATPPAMPEDLSPLSPDGPPLDLLSAPNRHAAGRPNEGKTAADAVLRAMAQAGIEGAEPLDILPGPVVSTIIIRPPSTARAPQILGLEEELRFRTGEAGLRLAKAPGVAGAVAIEVPVGSRASVPLRSVVASQEIRSAHGDLVAALGVTTRGLPIATDVAAWPHGLVAGQTGGGKSVFINALLISLLLRYPPAGLRLILIDPKRVELSAYRPLPHLLCPPVHTPAQSATAFAWAVEEMLARYDQMTAKGVKKLSDLNRRLAPEGQIPYIIVVVDEAQDLMSDKETKEAVVEASKRLAAMGRASGVHLWYSTQKPIVEVVPTTVKGNLPTRVAFRTVTTAESSVILDQAGAETLLGQGDALIKAVDGTITRIQSPFVEDEEVKRVVQWWADRVLQQFDPTLMSALGLPMPNAANDAHGEADDDDDHDGWDDGAGAGGGPSGPPRNPPRTPGGKNLRVVIGGRVVLDEHGHRPRPGR